MTFNPDNPSAEKAKPRAARGVKQGASAPFWHVPPGAVRYNGPVVPMEWVKQGNVTTIWNKAK